MGYNKITNLLCKRTQDEIPKFTTIKWIEIFDQSNATYNKNKDIRFKTNQLRNDLCDFNNAYIVVTGKITATNPGNNINDYNKKVALKNSAILHAQVVDIVMTMCNLLYYSKNFIKTTGSFWNYYPDMPKSRYNNNNRDRIFYSIRSSESFNYKKKLIVTLGDNVNVDGVITASLEDIKIVVPLKNLSNFMFNLDFLMINSKNELVLKWSEDCVLTGKATREAIAEDEDPATEPAVNAINRPTNLKSNITDCKMYVPVVTYQSKISKSALQRTKKRNNN